MFRFYDDELHNLILVAQRNVQEIISYTSNYDYHPPLQYVFNKIWLQLFGLNEFWLKLPSMILIILSILICCRLVYKITGSSKLSLLCGVVATFNPLILLWGASIRWYSLWTFLAVISIYLLAIIYADTNNRNRIILKSLLILSLTLALYTNYQTIILITAFFISGLIFDLKEKTKKYYHLTEIAQVIAGVIILFLPYIYVFFNHIETFFQRKEIYSDYGINSPFLATGYFIFSVFFGNSIYPWNIKFIVLLVITLIALIVSLFYVKTHSSKIKLGSFPPKEKKKLLFLLISLTITLFFLFLIQAIISGALLSRSFIIMPMLFTSLIVIYFYYLLRVKDRKLLFINMVAAVSFFLIWLTGSYNVITRQSLHKSGLMDPIGEVSAFVNSITASQNTNYSIITFDPVLTYYLAKSSTSNNVEIFSPYIIETQNLLTFVNEIKLNQDIKFDPGSTLIYIKSTAGSLIPLKEKLDYLDSYIFNECSQFDHPVKFGFDEDSEMKRIFFSGVNILDWRYTIFTLHPKSYWSKNILADFNSLRVY